MDKKNELSRRDFNRLTTAALGGLFGGVLAGCGASAPRGAAAADAPKDLHVCRGLNECKTDKNACAGQGQCSTAVAHTCASHNECKGQGGCGAKPGENACKGKGGCHVPLLDHAWSSARENFEKRMKAAGKPFGPAPKKS